MARMTLDVNGKVQTIDADPDMPLLYALRNELSLNNPHFGCGLAQCGACTVHVDGQAVRSCVTPVSAVGSSKVVTLAGLGTPEKPHPIQKAYVEEQVPQCGYCINGWIMTAAAFLNQTKKPTDAQIKEALTGLKCRCGTHMGILRAVKRLTARLTALNPHAAIHTAVEGDLDPRCLLEADAAAAGRAALRLGFVAEAEHSDGIASFVLTGDAPLLWEAFARAMETLIALRGPDLLRVKGLLNVAGCRGPVVVHVVQHLAHPPVELAAWPDADRASRLVFITRGISERQVRDLLASVRALAVDSG